MSTILKAGDAARDVQSVPFNFEDMAAKARDYLDRVRAEAARIVAQARQEAAEIRKLAEIEGQRAGQQQVEQIVEKRVAEQSATLLPMLRQVVKEIERAKQSWLKHWEKTGAHLAAAIAKRVVRRELSQAPEICLTLLREALELAAGSSQIRVHLNPGDHDTFGGEIQNLVAEVSSLGSGELIADPEIGQGGCRIETRFGIIDQRIETQLARIEEELT
ncbi:MAG: FliH/SctL family protein [Planctomycetota bacterium]|jgi:flagellar assembly protein FliH